jgi:AraC family transcriptional regulator of adaptative response/methylated-DNA-[protein]-cysteine methyltransferase
MITDTLKQEYYQTLVDAKIRYEQNRLALSYLETPIGHMIIIGDTACVYLVDFVDRRHIHQLIKRLQLRMQSNIAIGNTPVIQSMQDELIRYFAGTLREFKTPLHTDGTEFQQSAWHALKTIPYGQTTSYAAQATRIGKPSAYRAVANANGKNRCAIVIPCHRIITNNGKLGGYGGGITRKQWLLNHESKYNS